jgi:hypothetical protein
MPTTTLTLVPASASAAVAGPAVTLTATLTGSAAGLTATLVGLGTLSTMAPMSGVPFTWTPPAGGNGSSVVTVTDATDSLSAASTLGYSPPHLMAAILAAASADTTLAGITGGFWRGEKPADAALLESYCVLTRSGSSDGPYFSGGPVKDHRIRFRVYHSDPDASEALLDQLLASVPAWGALRYATGFSIPLVEAGTKSDPTKNRRTGDKAGWYTEANFCARCQRTL